MEKIPDLALASTGIESLSCYLLVLSYPIWHFPAALPPFCPVVFFRRRPAGAVLRRSSPIPVIGTTTPSGGKKDEKKDVNVD